jgi:hypothetical protein
MSEEIPEDPSLTNEATEAAVTPIPSAQLDESDSVPDLSEVDFGSLYSAIDQMANLLCDPNSLKNSIREKIARKALSGKWADVVEMLPDKPLLQRVGDEWHWLFDINANPLQIPDVTLKNGAKRASMQPTPSQPGQVAYTEALISGVERVNAALRFFTEDRLTLEELGTELRLLPISPTYNSFQLCATNYRANAGTGSIEQTYPSLASDKSLIQEFAASVSNAVRTIKRTIFLAEFLTYAKHSLSASPVQPPTSPTSRLRSEMMRLLATNLDFVQLTGQQIASMFAEFKSEFEENEQATREEFQGIDQDASSLDENWVAQIQGRIDELSVQTEPFTVSPDAQSWIDSYFITRAKAFTLHLRNRQKLKRLSLRDLRVLAYWKLPYPQGQLPEVPAIHGEPDNIPLLDYANALSATRSYPGRSSLVFALTVLVKLGFGKQVQALVFQFATTLGEESAADLMDAARASQHIGERVLLVLGGLPGQHVPIGSGGLMRTRKGEGSYAANWTLSKTHAVFPVHVTDIAGLLPYPNKDPLFFGMEISMEIDDEGVSPGHIGAPALQGSLGSSMIGKPTNLDDAVAIIKTIYANPART